MNVWIVTPAWSRLKVTRIALAQRAHLQGELARRGVELSCVVVADDENLDLAAEFGFDRLERNNDFLGRKVNDGIEHAYDLGADWICFAGSDNWLHPDLFEGLDGRGQEQVVAGRSLAVVDLPSGRSLVARVAGLKGAAPWLIPRVLFDTFGSRPAQETAAAGMEMQLAIGLGLPRFVFHDPNPCARVDFKTSVNMTPFAAFDRPGAEPARLRDFYPSDLCDLADRSRLAVGGVNVLERDAAYARNYDRIAEDHLDAVARTGHNPWQPDACVIANVAVTAGVIRNLVPLGATILDVGCGPGDLLNTMPDYQRHGVDISAAYAKVAAAKGILVEVARAESLPYDDAEFDAVVCADVLEHVLDLHATVSEALRVLKPRGTLIVRVPHEEDLCPYLSSEYEFVHLRRFDEPTLQLLFARIFPAQILMMFEFTVATEGTLAREIVCAVRKGG